MAKELPYFKFEPSAWDNGNIQMCSREGKGLFIDICSMYWARMGELPYALALQKHCNGNTNAMQELIEKEIIVIEDDQIIIEFLDEQLAEFIEIGNKRADAANKRWNANAMQMQCKSNPIKKREDKIKEDKKREDEFKSEVLAFADYPIEMLNKFISYWTEPNKSKTKMRFELEKTWDTGRRLVTWASRDKTSAGKPTETRDEYIKRIAGL